jgi:hypothetical protein
MEEVVDRLKAKKQAERERRAKLTQAQRDAEDLAAERQRLRDERWDQEQQAKRYDVHGAKTGAKAGRSVDLTGGKNGLKEDASKRIGN